MFSTAVFWRSVSADRCAFAEQEDGRGRVRHGKLPAGLVLLAAIDGGAGLEFYECGQPHADLVRARSILGGWHAVFRSPRFAVAAAVRAGAGLHNVAVGGAVVSGDCGTLRLAVRDVGAGLFGHGGYRGVRREDLCQRPAR
ncbi:hypothetical protein D3C87_1678110 [compost metagenome]